MSSGLAPLLVGLARAAVKRLPASESDRERLSALTETEWRELVALAAAHDLGPMLDAGARVSGIAPPAPLAESLLQAARAREVLADRAAEQLSEMIQALNDAGIQPILLKGALLAWRYYPTPGLRPFTDVDLLVRIEERERAAAVLTNLGYLEAMSQYGRSREWYSRVHMHWMFRCSQRLLVELHWALTSPASRAQFDTKALWDRSPVLEWRGGWVRELALEDQILFLATHATKHRFRVPFRHLLDLAALIEVHGFPSFDPIWERARAYGAELDLAAYLGVAERWKVISFPAEESKRIVELTRGHLALADLARYAMDWPCVDYPYAVVEILAAPSRRAAIRVMRRLLFPSGGKDLSPGYTAASGELPEGGKQWGPAARRYLRRLVRLRSIGATLRLAVALRRRFSDREAVEPAPGPQ